MPNPIMRQISACAPRAGHAPPFEPENAAVPDQLALGRQGLPNLPNVGEALAPPRPRVRDAQRGFARRVLAALAMSAHGLQALGEGREAVREAAALPRPRARNAQRGQEIEPAARPLIGYMGMLANLVLANGFGELGARLPPPQVGANEQQALAAGPLPNALGDLMGQEWYQIDLQELPVAPFDNLQLQDPDLGILPWAGEWGQPQQAFGAGPLPNALGDPLGPEFAGGPPMYQIVPLPPAALPNVLGAAMGWDFAAGFPPYENIPWAGAGGQPGLLGDEHALQRIGHIGVDQVPPQNGRELRRDGVNVHNRDTDTLKSIQTLLASGFAARDPQTSLDDIATFIGTCERKQQPARLLAVDAQQKMTGLQLARKTLENVSSPLNLYPSQSGEDNEKVPTREVCAMLWECIGRLTDGPGQAVSEADGTLLRYQFIAALSDSYVWGNICSEGQVQRLAVGLQGYYPQIQIDPQVQQQNMGLVTPVGEFVTTACMRLQHIRNADDLESVANEAFAEAMTMYRDDAESQQKVAEVGLQLKDYLMLSHDVVWNPPLH